MFFVRQYSFSSTIRRVQVQVQIYRCVQFKFVLLSSSWSSIQAVINKITYAYPSVRLTARWTVAVVVRSPPVIDR